jgi:hypothetical protein
MINIAFSFSENALVYNTIYALAKDEKRFSAQERRDRSEKPGTSDEERETSEDLQRIAPAASAGQAEPMPPKVISLTAKAF